MPHLMNCPHIGDGWCLSCVSELQMKQNIETDPRKVFFIDCENMSPLQVEAYLEAIKDKFKNQIVA